MSLLVDDLSSALKELQETALIMTSGKLPTASEMERFHKAIEWSKRVLDRIERES